jgi:hypothetical protein
MKAVLIGVAMDKALSPRAFLIRFALIWLTGLVPSGLVSLAFAKDDHPMAPFALGLFLALAAGGLYLGRAAMRAIYPQR